MRPVSAFRRTVWGNTPLRFAVTSPPPSRASKWLVGAAVGIAGAATFAQLEAAPVKAPVLTKKWYYYRGPVDDEEKRRFKEDCILLPGSANPELSAEISQYLGIPLSPSNASTFADGEVSIRFEESVRSKAVYIIQPVCRSSTKSVNDALVELLLMVSAAKRGSAAKITAVIPYYGYARQDRKIKSRTPISAADVAVLISSMGVDRVVAIDLHCGQIQGFFPPSVPVDNLNAGGVGASYFSEKTLHNPVVVSPDAGGVARAKEFRSVLEARGHSEVGLAMIIKQRSGASKIEKMDLVGSVEGCDVVIVDDMIDTAGTLCKAAEKLKEHGAKRVFAFATHGLFSGPAAERIEGSCLEEVVVTNTVPLPEGCVPVEKIVQVSLAPSIAEVIFRLQAHKSLSSLYKV